MVSTKHGLITTSVTLAVEGADRIEPPEKYARKTAQLTLARLLHTALTDLLSGPNSLPGPGFVKVNLRHARDSSSLNQVSGENLRGWIDACWKQPVEKKYDGLTVQVSWTPQAESGGRAKVRGTINLTNQPKVGQSSGMGAEDERAEDHAQEAFANASLGEPAKEDFANASLDDLVAAFTPRPPKAAIRRLETLIRQAQEHTPADKPGFVRDVNLLLDVLSLRIRTEDGEVGRLNLDRNEVICLTRQGGRGTRGFKNTSIELVSVPRIRVGNRFTAAKFPPHP